MELGNQLVAVNERELEVGEVFDEPAQYLFPGTLCWRYSGNVCCDSTAKRIARRSGSSA
jgi:hypothetical protein